MPSNLPEIRELNEVFYQKRKQPGTFMRSMFFKSPIKKHSTDVIDIQVKKGDIRVAPYSKPCSASLPWDRTGFTESSIKLPSIGLHRTTEPCDLFHQQLGQSVIVFSGSNDPEARKAAKDAEDIQDMDDAITRAEELQAAQAVTQGTVILRGDGVDLFVDMRRDPSLTIPKVGLPSAGWTSTSNIGKDFRFAGNRVYNLSGLLPNVALFGYDALELFLDNEGVLKKMDNRNVDAGRLSLGGGVSPTNASYFGNYDGLDIWLYRERYRDIDGTVKDMIAPGDVILGSTAATARFHYAPIYAFKSLIPEPRFIDTDENKDPDVNKIIMRSRPLALLEEPDAFTRLTVI